MIQIGLYYTNHTMYMNDPKKTNSGKALRFASGCKTRTGEQLYIQFGEGDGIHLLLSQPCHEMESRLLRVINYVNALYADFMNESIDIKLGKNVADRHGFIYDENFFDSVMTNVSNNSNYGIHTDAKSGLFINSTMDTHNACLRPNKKSAFHLTVPSFCVQNHTKEATFVEWYDRKTGKQLLSIPCKTAMFHWQLAGVQSNCTHGVRTDTTMDDFGFHPGPKIPNSDVIYDCLIKGHLPKRLVVSARHTAPLQQNGIDEIEKTRSLKHIPCYGRSGDSLFKSNLSSEIGDYQKK